jgi:hypothetical protein
VITAPYLDHSDATALGESRRLYREVEAVTRADLQHVLRTGERHRWSTWIVDDQRPAAVLSRPVPQEPPRLAVAADATDGRFIMLAITACTRGRWRTLPDSLTEQPWVAWGSDANGLVTPTIGAGRLQEAFAGRQALELTAVACASQADAEGIAAQIVLDRSTHSQDRVLTLRSWS